MNTHATYTDLPWSAVAKMREAGYGWHAIAIDFVFYPSTSASPSLKAGQEPCSPTTPGSPPDSR